MVWIPAYAGMTKTRVIPHLMRNPFITVWIPAYAGMTEGKIVIKIWIPAFAGITKREAGIDERKDKKDSQGKQRSSLKKCFL